MDVFMLVEVNNKTKEIKFIDYFTKENLDNYKSIIKKIKKEDCTYFLLSAIKI